jgi:hypothetical protein
MGLLPVCMALCEDQEVRETNIGFFLRPLLLAHTPSPNKGIPAPLYGLTMEKQWGYYLASEQPPLVSIITPKGNWDVESLPDQRKLDGTLDLTNLVAVPVTRPLLLVQSLKMVLENTVLG